MATESEIIKQKSEQQQVTIIDFKRIFYQALRYWYVVLFFLGAALTIAFYKNRYTQRIYPTIASIIIREGEETSGAELLYKNSLVDQYRNYLNEPYILRSYPLVQKVVEDGNFDVSFFQEGFIRTSEAYKVLPINVILKRDQPAAGRWIFTLLDTATFSLQPSKKDEEVSSKAQLFKLNEPFQINNNNLTIEKIEGTSFNGYLNTPFVLEIKNSFTLATEYSGKLTIDWAEEGSGVLFIKLNGPTPAKDIDFINGLIARYQQSDLDKKNQTANKTVDFISDQLRKISDSLRLFEGQLQRFKMDNHTSGNLDVEAQRIFTKIENLEVQKAELMMKEQYYSYIKKYIAESKNLEQVILPSSLGVSDAVISSLVGQISSLQLDLKLFMDREKTMSPLVQAKMSKLNELKKEVLESVEGLRSTDKIRLTFLEKQISEAEKQIGYLPLAERQLVSIKRNYSLLENLYVFLMQKMSEAEISKASSASDIQVVNPPLVSGGSITPKISQNYTYATIIGLGIPFLIFFLIELFNTNVQSKQDVDKITSIPFIAGIGHKKSLSNLEVLNAPKSAIAESFRALRSNLNYFVDLKTHPVFLVSSSISGEGKTFTSLNLASIFALSEKKTLLIGADMRKPKIYQDFQLSNEKGLSTYLSEMHTFDEILQKTTHPYLDMISGGPVPPNPSELLLSLKVEGFVKEAKKRYDFVIIDTPPMAIVTDAFILANYVDHTLFIVRQNYTPKALIKTADDFYSTGKLKNMSIVLNDIYRSGLGYGYGYGYGYEYYSYGYGAKKNGYGYYTES